MRRSRMQEKGFRRMKHRMKPYGHLSLKVHNVDCDINALIGNSMLGYDINVLVGQMLSHNLTSKSNMSPYHSVQMRIRH